jgi:hypothetical protein
MWGGIKHARDYSQHFRDWSPNKPLESLRRALFREPRPWFLGFQIDRHNHAIDDRSGEKLLRWCTSIVSLESNSARRREAYHNSYELFKLMISRKPVSDSTFAQFLSLCEVGADVTSAYEWIRFMVERRSAELPVNSDEAVKIPISQQPYQLWHYVWLLRIVAKSPNDDVVDEMVQAVRDVYETIFSPSRPDGAVEANNGEEVETSSEEIVVRHMVCDNFEEALLQRELFALVRNLISRIQDKELRSWCMRAESSLVVSPDVACATSSDVCVAMKLQQWVFPQLDAQLAPQEEIAEITKVVDNSGHRSPSIGRPYLTDSLLSPAFLEKIQSASFSFDVQAVGFWIQAFLEDIAGEKAKAHNASGSQQQKKAGYHHISTPTNPIPVWRDYRSHSHQAYRKQIVDEQGVPAELYHYLIVALSQLSPRMALVTKQKMSALGMRALDLTRAVLIVSCKESFEDQKALLIEQQQDFARRVQIDIDFETPKVIESFWKFEYHELFYLRNGAKKMQDFYVWLMDALDVPDVQRLIAATSDTLIHEEELVALDEEVKDAVYRTLRKRRGAEAVESALDVITEHCPMLDLALINAFPHFKEYTLADNDEIATTVSELARRLFVSSSTQRSQDVYVMDSSFIETSEQFSTVTQQSARESVIVIPWFCLKHLVETIEGVDEHCMDAELVKVRRHERNIAVQRLQQISALLLQQRAEKYIGPKLVMLHFSECLLAQAIPLSEFPTLSPETSDNDLMTSLLIMLSTVRGASSSGTTSQVFLCSDDPQLLERVTNDVASYLPQVTVLSTPHVEEAEGMEPQNQLLAVSMVSSVAANFEPNLGNKIVRVPKTNVGTQLETAAVQPPPLPAADVGHQRQDPSAEDLFGDVDEGHSLDATKVALSPPTPHVRDDENTPASSWMSMLDGLESDHEAAGSHTVDGACAAVVNVPQGRPSIVEDVSSELKHTNKLVDDSETDDQLFSEFGVMTPDQRLELEMQRHPGRGHNDGQQTRRPSVLQRESSRNKGYNKRGRLQLARELSNTVGRRVPFNFRYKVYEANVSDPRNAHLKRSFDEQRKK